MVGLGAARTVRRVSPHPNALFSPATTVTQHRHLVGALVATSPRTATSPAWRLPLPLTRTVGARVTHRPGPADLAVLVTRRHGLVPDLIAAPLIKALNAVAASAGVGGRCEVRLGETYTRDSGADLANGFTWAAVDAFLDAAGVHRTDKIVEAARAASGLGDPAVGTEPGLGPVETATGVHLDQWRDFPRLGVLSLYLPGVSTVTEVDGGVPTGLPAPAQNLAGGDAAAWLCELNGPVGGPVAEHIAAVVARHPVAFGMVGGHSESDPVAVLCDPAPERLIDMQALRIELSAAVREVALKSPWAVTASRIAACVG